MFHIAYVSGKIVLFISTQSTNPNGAWAEKIYVGRECCNYVSILNKKEVVTCDEGYSD